MNNYLNEYQSKLKEVAKKYINNEITYVEFKETTLELTKKASLISAKFKAEIDIKNDDSCENKVSIPQGQIA